MVAVWSRNCQDPNCTCTTCCDEREVRRLLAALKRLTGRDYVPFE